MSIQRNNEEGLDAEKSTSSCAPSDHDIPACTANKWPGTWSSTLSGSLLVPSLPNASEHPPFLKWILTIIVALCAAVAPLGSTILVPVLAPLVRDLQTTREAANLSIAFYSLSVAIFPLYWSSFGEIFGRRPVYLLSFILLAVFNTCSATSTSIGPFVAFRLLAGSASSAVLSMGAATIADLWSTEKRGQAMGIFFLGPLIAPVIAPVIGGSMTHRLGWRSTQWFLTIYAGLLWIVIVLLLPETKPTSVAKPRLVQTEEPGSPRNRFLTGISSAWSIVSIPIRVIPLFRFLPITLVVWYGSITFASYYFLNISIQATYSYDPWNFNPVLTGLLYLPSAVGASLGSIVGVRWADYTMICKAKLAERYDQEGKLKTCPQDRIDPMAWSAGLAYPLALLAYGWMAEYNVHWMGPCAVMFVYGAGQALLFNITTTMLTELTPKKASLGVAMNNLVRNTLACIAAASSQPLLERIGSGWLFTAVCVICLSSVVTLGLLKKHTEEWSKKMVVGLAKF